MSQPTCATCRHWLPRETPLWAARLGMAICALTLSKAITYVPRHTCGRHVSASVNDVASRAAWIAVDPLAPPGLPPPPVGSPTGATPEGNSSPERIFLGGNSKQVKWSEGG